MYLLWTTVYLPLALYYYWTDDKPFIVNTINYFKNLLTIGEHYNSIMLWYLLSVIYALCFVYYLTIKGFKLHTFVILGAILFFFGQLVSFLVNYTEILPYYLECLKKILQSVLLSGRIFRGFLYIPVGIALSTLSFSKSKGIFIIGVNTIIWLTIPNNIPFVKDWIVVFASVGIFMFVNSFTLSPNNIYRKLRTFSTVMFFTHMWIWTICYAVIYQTRTFGMEIYLITTAITLLIAYAYTRICTKNPRTAERPLGL